MSEEKEIHFSSWNEACEYIVKCLLDSAETALYQYTNNVYLTHEEETHEYEIKVSSENETENYTLVDKE